MTDVLQQSQPQLPVGPAARAWTGRRIAAVIFGVVVVLAGVAFAATGLVAIALDAGRSSGYVDLDATSFQTGSYALDGQTLMSDEAVTSDQTWLSLFGTARIQVSELDGSRPIFVGVTSAAEAQAYLSSTSHDDFRDTAKGAVYVGRPGGAPSELPAGANIWISQSSGTGSQTVYVPAKQPFTLVVMNADGSRALNVRVDLAASLPGLGLFGAGLLVVGLLVFAGGVALIVVPIRRARAARRTA